jgi:hypothetical protein
MPHTHELETTTDAALLAEVTAALAWPASGDEEVVEVGRCRLCQKLLLARWSGPNGGGTVTLESVSPSTAGD